MAKKQTTWICTGLGDDNYPFHEPYENSFDGCDKCGITQKEFFEKTGKKPPKDDRKLPVPLPLIAAGVAVVVVLGGATIASPNIPGLCGIAANCASWKDDLTKAKKQGEPAKDLAATAKTLPELEESRQQLQGAIKLLKAIPPNANINIDVRRSLSSYQETLDAIEPRIQKEQTAQQALDKAKSLAKDGKAEKALKEAIAQLKSVPPDSLAASVAKTQLSDYEAKLVVIASKSASRKPEPEPLPTNSSTSTPPLPELPPEPPNVTTTPSVEPPPEYTPDPAPDNVLPPSEPARPAPTEPNRPPTRTPLWGPGAPPPN